jgi:Ca2+-transporting ATPase
LRLLALAYKHSGSLEDEDGFSWNGLVGLEDPIREGVVEAVQVARRAGVQVKMITGDYKLTAEHIAKNIGILDENSLVMDGEELNILDDNQLKALIGRVSVFARIRPFDKLRIISTLQDCGEITAMIGDGVNDAPALQRANIGVVVGSATDVAKESADLILMDNNFRTIVAAIEEGRVIFENIQKVVSYVLSNSFAEIILIFIAMMAGWPAPLLVAQILWIHLICDGPADIMLGFEPKEAGIMEKRPKSMKEQILTPLGFSLILFISIACAIVGLILFDFTLHNSGSVELARSLVFAVFCVVDMIYIFAYKSLHISILKGNGLLSNKPLLISAIGGILTAFAAFLVAPLREALKLIPLTFKDYLLVFGIGIAMLVFVEIGKWIVRLKHKLLA